ncbi:MAG: hypothetical protein ACK4VI_08750 [Alphaproteobacteria bacterium]
MASVLLIEPLKESLFIDQNAATGAADDFIKTVLVGIKKPDGANRQQAASCDVSAIR